MFWFERHRGSSRPYSAQDFTLKGAVILALKQIGFLIVIGCIIWLAHTLAHSPSHASTPPHGLDFNKGGKAKMKVTAAQSPNRTLPIDKRTETRPIDTGYPSPATEQSAGDTEHHDAGR